MARPTLPRLAHAQLVDAMETVPVTVVTGARQTGKSTLVRTAPQLSEHVYLSLDDMSVRAQAREDPEGLVRRAPRLILDEVQREPELLLAIKAAVDEEGGRRPGRFVLTGSADLLLMKSVTESLAGRSAYVTLHPLTRSEANGHGGCGRWADLMATPFDGWMALLEAEAGKREREAWQSWAVRGGMPEPAYQLRAARHRAVWYDGYIRTFLERDLRDLSGIGDLADFRRLMRIAALRRGGIENQADLARDAGLSRPTARRWLNLLQTSYQLVRVQPYSLNRTKRLVKSPRLYWSDTGLGMVVAGESSPEGAHLESLILGDLLAWRDSVLPRPEILYWRTYEGAEVDFVIEARGRLMPIEVKSTSRPSFAHTRHLRTFHEEYDEAVCGGLLLHDGDRAETLTRGVLAVPWWWVV